MLYGSIEIIKIINSMILILKTLFLSFQELEVVYESIAVEYVELITIENKGTFL